MLHARFNSNFCKIPNREVKPYLPYRSTDTVMFGNKPIKFIARVKFPNFVQRLIQLLL